MILEDEWSSYGIGDPYILKHRGIFYLYCSTKDNEVGVKTWSSKDLENWTYEGLCSTDPITKGAYAPEVIYWNGMFYMYTSPAGNGHFVLFSDSPTGPFTVISSNYGKWIDGSVYVNDDGNLYFLHASPWGIQGCIMDTPSSFGESINLNAQMNNTWTEGPCLFRRYGKNYMIYTGNHLISKGYRIDYATNIKGPLDQYTPATGQNPILLNTMGDHVGLGHGSIFIGPDLDSYYLTYHNLVSRHGPQRNLNFDRIAWNHDKMMLLGSTNFEQQGAALPDAYDYFDRAVPGDAWNMPNGGVWSIPNADYLLQDASFTGVETWYKAMFDSLTRDNFTAEFNLREITKESDDARAGAVFSYLDEGSFAIALIHGSTRLLEINFLKENVWGTPQYFELPADFDFSVWHSLRIERFNGQFQFFVDGLLKGTLISDAGPGKIGYLTSRNHVAFDFIGFSNKVKGSGVFNVYKPLPGKIDAVLYNQGGEGEAYHEETPENPAELHIRIDETEIVECSRGGYAISSVKPGDWYKYNINVESNGLYNYEIVYASESSENSIRVLINDTDVSGAVELPSTGGPDQWRSVIIKDLQIPDGYHTLKIVAVSGDFDFYSMHFVMADNVPFDEKLDFEFSFGKGWEYYDGNWSIQDKKAVIFGYGKRAFGSSLWTDYTVKTDILFTRRLDAGLIFRINNPANGGADDDPVQGNIFLQGYSIRFSPSNVILEKHNYDKRILATSPGSFTTDTWYNLKVVLMDANIRVYVDDMLNPAINYTDKDPFINGMAGYRCLDADAQFDNFRITSDTLTSSVEEPGFFDENKFKIYPNPASGKLSIDFNEVGERQVSILNINGEEVLFRQSSSEQISIQLRDLIPGIYVIQILEKNSVYSRKLIIE